MSTTCAVVYVVLGIMGYSIIGAVTAGIMVRTGTTAKKDDLPKMPSPLFFGAFWPALILIFVFVGLYYIAKWTLFFPAIFVYKLISGEEW